MPEHFYIHVSGTQKNASPQFGTATHTESLLQHRPGLLTPFLTPHLTKVILTEEHLAQFGTFSRFRDYTTAEHLVGLPAFGHKVGLRTQI